MPAKTTPYEPTGYDSDLRETLIYSSRSKSQARRHDVCVLKRMEPQVSFAQAEYAGKKKTTRRDKFLSEMNQLVPWARLVELVCPHYPTGKRGRPPMGIEKMLRVYFLQQWYGLADEPLEDTIYDSQAMRGFAGIDLGGTSSVPDATTLLNFRHLLEEHALTKHMLEEVNRHLTERGPLMREGTLVDATIIAAPNSTKNKSAQRDPEMHQTKKQPVALRNEGAHRSRRRLGAGA